MCLYNQVSDSCPNMKCRTPFSPTDDIVAKLMEQNLHESDKESITTPFFDLMEEGDYFDGERETLDAQEEIR